MKRLTDSFRYLFTLSTRSLAVCRIFTGLVIIGDLISRALEFRLHYTKSGILPLAFAKENQLIDFPSIYALNDSTGVVAGLFLFHTLVAISLTLGYRTRVSTVLAWYLCRSLATRNFLVNNGGDAVLVILLFWAIFVPWGQVWSLDALRDDEKEVPSTICTPGTMCFIGQLYLMYWSSVVHKMEPSWLEGQALYYAFSCELYSRPLSHHFLAYPSILTAFTYGALLFELLAPLLLLVRNDKARILSCCAFFVLHSGFGIFLRLGIFQWTPCLVFIALMPHWVWSKFPIPHLVPQPALQRAAVALQAKPDRVSVSPLLSAVLGFLFVFSIIKSLENHVTGTKWMPQHFRFIADYTGLKQTWSVFIRLNECSDLWAQMPAELEDGSTVDLFQGRDPIHWKKPRVVSEEHDHFRWPTPLATVANRPELRETFLEGFINEWNRDHPQRQVKEAKFVIFLEQTLENYVDSPPVKQELHHWQAEPDES